MTTGPVGGKDAGLVPRDDAPRVRLTTEAMAYGPHAVARHDGRVIFVRGAAPDEVVDAVIREEHRAYAFADVAAVVRPSEARRVPPCRYLPRCGGCSWQHLSYAAQLAAKRRNVEDQLRRIAHLEVPVAPVEPSPREFGARRRIKLRVERGEVGYYAAASHVLVAIDECLLANSAVDAAIGWARELVATVALPLRRVELVGGAADDDIVVAGEVAGGWDEAADPDCRSWLAAHPRVRGLALRGREWQRDWGQVHIAFAPEAGLPLRAHALTFTQINPAVNCRLVETVARWIDPGAGCSVLDLYAGAGNFSLPLRRRGARVLAVEQSPRAAADAAANAERFPGPGLRVICARAERAVQRLADAGQRFDAVVLDPPRSGAAPCIEGLLRLAAPRLVYVSCDPATLARDLARLGARYRVDAVQPFDMFPQTYHVETAVLATLTCDSGTPSVSSARRHGLVEPSRRRRTRGRTL